MYAAAVVVGWALIIAGQDPWEKLLGYGVLGVYSVLTLLGWVWPKPSVQHLFDAIAERDRQIAALNAKLDEGAKVWNDTARVLADTIKSNEAAVRTSERVAEYLHDLLRGAK